MPIARFQMPDGRVARFEVPEGTTPEQAQAMIAKEAESLPKQEAQKDSGSTLKNIGLGALKGASDIGATILSPIDSLGITGMTPDQRRASLGQFFSENADTDSAAFKGGEIGANVAGTAGAGGLLAKGAQAIPMLARFAPALASGGFNLGPAATGSKLANAAIRAGSGATVGATAAGLINPDDVGTGAAIGGAMPGAVGAAGAVGKGLRSLGESVASNALGASTGTGAEAIRGAYRAGKTGATEFLDNMRGNASFDDVIARAKEGLSKMRQDRAAAYRGGMVDIKADKTVLDFQPISEAMSKVGAMGSFKGQQINKNAAGTVSELQDAVSNWAKLNPAEYHTPEGLDALKQAVGDIRDTTQFGTAARRAADSVYNAVKEQINAQAPAYAKVMKDYSKASETLKEVEKALSLGDKTSKDTAIRKLQSLTRNNVQTNYGNRAALASVLEDQGGVSLMPAIAGQAMSSATPRGLIGAAEKGGLLGAAVLSPSSIPALLAAAPLTSPRIVGEGLYGLGRLSGMTQDAFRNATQGQIGGLLSPALMDANRAFARTLPIAISANP